MPVTLATDYETRLDAKHRLTLKGATAKHFRVKARKDGSYVVTPMVLAKPEEVISERTRKGIKLAIENMKAGRRSGPEDLKKLAAMRP